jgi:hypothetical protein
VSAELGVVPTTALALLRARAYGQGIPADDVAADLLSGRLRARDLQAPTDV